MILCLRIWQTSRYCSCNSDTNNSIRGSCARWGCVAERHDNMGHQFSEHTLNNEFWVLWEWLETVASWAQGQKLHFLPGCSSWICHYKWMVTYCWSNSIYSGKLLFIPWALIFAKQQTENWILCAFKSSWKTLPVLLLPVLESYTSVHINKVTIITVTIIIVHTNLYYNQPL